MTTYPYLVYLKDTTGEILETSIVDATRAMTAVSAANAYARCRAYYQEEGVRCTPHARRVDAARSMPRGRWKRS